jgi:sn-glycerol 3-phosphate transport system permease protein
MIVRPPMPLLPGDAFHRELLEALITEGWWRQRAGLEMLLNSLVMALGIAIGKIIISLLSAYAIVYFRFRFRMLFFWLIFITLMLPVEVRIVPTYEVVAASACSTATRGLIFPLIASATATFLFRQFFMTIPDELAEARASTARGRCGSSSTSCCR